MSKHTQGPWVANKKTNGAFKVSAGMDICRVYINYNQSEFEAKANAVLIAAAPDLLEVVHAMANFDGRNNNQALKNMAQAAIAKAEAQ
jgi:hypothetical protein